MRTVKNLIEELQKFPPTALCGAYEGEATGICVHTDKGYGFIHCADSAGLCEDKETEMPK